MSSKQFNAYANALVPEPYIILGVTLRPLCLAHIFLMQKFGCRFSSEDPETLGGIDDLILGIAICSRTHQEFLDFVNDPKELNRWSKRWGKAIRKQIKKEPQFDLFAKFQLFKDYLKSGIYVPKYWELERTENATESGTHWTHTVLNTLTAELGYTQDEALNVPLARALHDYFRCLEKNGVLTIMSDADLALAEPVAA